jgi:dipeptidyl aminopeptidase/acylaminoacyl peptidase
VPLDQSERLAAALRAAGVPVTLPILPDAGRGGPAFDAPEMRQAVREFLHQIRP